MCKRITPFAIITIALLVSFSATTTSACPGDFDGNRSVNIADFLAFVNVYGSGSADATYNAQMDLDSSGSIDTADFLAFVEVFGTTCPGGGDSSNAITRMVFESHSVWYISDTGYTAVTLKDNGTVWGVPTQYTDDSDIGTVAYMLLAKLKGCSFADAEADRESKVYIKTQALGSLPSFASESVCRKMSSSYGSWRGVRITHLRFFDESSSTNIREAVYNASMGQYRVVEFEREFVDFESSSNTPTIYMTHGSGIFRTNLIAVQHLVTAENSPSNIALDAAGGKMYWTAYDGDNKTIRRANLDGSNVEVISTSYTNNIALSGGKLYWTNYINQQVHILRANLDGSNVQRFLVGGGSASTGIALSGDKVYWLAWGSFSIWRADLNGFNIETLVEVGETSYIAYRGPVETLVEEDATPYIVYRGPLAGWGESFALDVTGGKMYWTVYNPRNVDYEPAPYKHTTIRRANLDGSNVESFITRYTDSRSNVLVWAVAGGKVYWTNRNNIWRANLDGTNVEEIFNSGAFGLTIYSLAVDMGR